MCWVMAAIKLPSGKRGISKEVARKLSNFFKVPIDRFI